MLIKKFEIDLSKASPYVDGKHDEIIYRVLRSQCLFNVNCLYSVCDGDEIEELKKTGTYRRKSNSIFAFTKPELVWDNHPELNDVEAHAIRYKNPALAVFKRCHFEIVSHLKEEKDDWKEYRFKNPDKKLEALLGVGILKFD